MSDVSRDHSETASVTGLARRYVVILVRLLPFALAFLRDRHRFLLVGGSRSLPEDAHRDRARRLTETLIDLGPAFIKAGQILSTRPDLVPPIYADALSRLQDEVPESRAVDPVEILRTDLGSDVIDFETLEPIAGGSLAYVYVAERVGSDERVAIKLRRPNVKPKIERDLHILRRLIPLVSVVAPERHRYSLRNIADDFETIILQELDFEREAEMMARIRENLADDDRVRIPRAETSVSTDRVLVMEHITAAKITDDSAIERRDVTREDLAATIADVYLRMGLRDGVFHADPHPGNLAVDDDGKLVIYDFGMCQAIDPAVQAEIVDLYLSLSRRDIDGLIEALIGLDVLERTVDRRQIRQVLDLSIESLAGQSRLTWRDIFSEITVSLREFPFRIPPDVMLLVRVGTVGEGVCRGLDPEFDFLTAVRSHLVEEGYVERELRSQFAELREELVRSAPAVTRLPRRLDTVLERLDRGEIVVRTERVDRPRDSGTAFAILSAGLFVAASVVYPYAQIAATVATVGAVVCLWLMLRRRR